MPKNLLNRNIVVTFVTQLYNKITISGFRLRFSAAVASSRQSTIVDLGWRQRGKVGILAFFTVT